MESAIAKGAPAGKDAAMRFTNLTRDVEIGANCYLLEAGGHRLVLDSGMHPKERGIKAQPDFSLLGAEPVDAIFLTHAHHDHVGTLPLLMRRQPDAKVFMTEPTRRFGDVMLHNSVNVMTKQAEDPLFQNYPLFTHREVDRCVKRWTGVPLRQCIDFTGERIGRREGADGSFELFDAGHILGSAGVLIRAGGRSVFYTGDVNFEDQTICRAARFPEEPLDVLIMETTRGDSPTPENYSRAREIARLRDAISQAFARQGCVLIPIFALGKTQELLGILHDLRTRGQLPHFPIYIGGLSAKLTEIYDKLAYQSPRLEADLQILDHVAPYVVAGREAETVPVKHGHVYTLSSGMMTENTLSNVFARRILEDPVESIFFVGYADPESPAGRLRAATPGQRVQLDPDFPEQELRCDVQTFAFSGHATRETLRGYVNKVRPRKVILIHGDRPAVEWFRATLATDLPESEVIVPEPGVTLEI